MKKQLYIPACHQYIRNKDGSPNAQRIFSVTKSAYQAKYPDQILPQDELFAFLQANHVIPSETQKDELDTEHVELCFTIISQYKCNSICQLCAYSPLYKNQFERQESILIGYALANWNNLQNLLHSGITCRHFRSVIPVSEKSAVLVVPLNRLAFEYLEKIPKSQKDMLSVTDKIISSLKENNKDKLSAADLKIAKKYLENLFNSNFQNLRPKEIDRILKECFQLSYRKMDRPNVSEPTIPKEDSAPKTAYLEGFLTGKPPVKSGNRNLQKETAGKNNVEKKKIASPKSEQTITSSYTQKTDCRKPAAGPDHLLARKPFIWECPQDMFLHIPSINLDLADSAQTELFLKNLLMTPLLPVEIINYQQKELVLIYAGNQFYYYSKSNLTILDALLPYIEKSRFRKILCYEPYELYAYFHQQQCHDIQVFSFRLAMDFACPIHLWNSAPDLILKENCGIEASEQIPVIVHIMKNYHILYRKVMNDLKKAGGEQKSAYREKYYVTQLSGYSYYKEVYSAFKGRLFSKETRDGYIFTYTSKEKLLPPYRAVCFQIRWNSKEGFPVEKMLSKIAEHKVPEKHDIFLLAFNRNGAAFAVADSEYSYCCELVSHLSCYIAEKENKLPVHIDECPWRDKLE